MKISAALLAATCSAEWTKPSYYDFIYKDQSQMRASGMANWGHPVVGSTRHWSDCPTLDVPEGALGLRCNAGTCALLCPGGSRATGRRRVRCRYTKKLGWYWKSKLGKCQTCEVETPMSNDSLMTTACKVWFELWSVSVISGSRPDKKKWFLSGTVALKIVYS